jgi:polyisoprenyl-phosphate glycosyltransferase
MNYGKKEVHLGAIGRLTMKTQDRKKRISIITPCYNEEENIRDCILAVRKIMTEELPEYDYEHIFSDNASTDHSVAEVKKFAEHDSRIKLIVNSRNVGPFNNMWNALKSANGDAVIPLVPADLQDPPSVIPYFVQHWVNGNLVVYGIRKNREESLSMRFLRGAYYRIIRKFAAAVIPINSGEFLLADKKVIDSILKRDDDYPYIRGLIAQTAVKSERVEYTWVKRRHGKSKNSFLQLIDQAINGFVSTSRLPARITLLAGFIFSIIGLCGAGFTFIAFLLNRETTPVGIPTIVVSIFLFGGLQLLFLGIIGEYVLSIHGQVRRIPPLIEMERVNFANGTQSGD